MPLTPLRIILTIFPWALRVEFSRFIGVTGVPAESSSCLGCSDCAFLVSSIPSGSAASVEQPVDRRTKEIAIKKEDNFCIEHLSCASKHRRFWGLNSVGIYIFLSVIVNLLFITSKGFANSLLARGELLSPAPSYSTPPYHWRLGIQNGLAFYQDKKVGQDKKKQRVHAIPTLFISGQTPFHLQLKSYVGFIRLSDEIEQVKVQQTMLGLGLGREFGRNEFGSSRLYLVSQWIDTQASGALVVDEYESYFRSKSYLVGAMFQIADTNDAAFANFGVAQSNQEAEFQLVTSLPVVKNQSPGALSEIVPLLWLELGYRFSKNVSLSLTEQRTPNLILLPRINLAWEMVFI